MRKPVKVMLMMVVLILMTMKMMNMEANTRTMKKPASLGQYQKCDGMMMRSRIHLVSQNTAPNTAHHRYPPSPI
jgi:hypothetical protein